MLVWHPCSQVYRSKQWLKAEHASGGWCAKEPWESCVELLLIFAGHTELEIWQGPPDRQSRRESGITRPVLTDVISEITSEDLVHAMCALGQNCERMRWPSPTLIFMVVPSPAFERGAGYDIKNLSNPFEWDTIPEEVGHGTGEDVLCLAPPKGIVKNSVAETWTIKAIGPATKTLAEAVGVTMRASGGDFCARPSTVDGLDGIPSAVGPRDSRVLSHDFYSW